MGVFVLDSKYYKFGMKLDRTDKTRFLPGSESVCKQMAYAEYVEEKILKGGGFPPSRG